MQSFGSHRPLRTRNDLSHPGCGYTTAIADPCDAARAWWEHMGGRLAMWLSRKRRSRRHYLIQMSTFRLQLVVCLPMLTLALRSLASLMASQPLDDLLWTRFPNTARRGLSPTAVSPLLNKRRSCILHSTPFAFSNARAAPFLPPRGRPDRHPRAILMAPLGLVKSNLDTAYRHGYCDPLRCGRG